MDWKNPLHILAFGFGTGASPIMPGTVGTLVGFALGWLLIPLPWIYAVAIMVILTLLGCWLCGVVSRQLGVHDHSGIVWDEIVAFAGLLLLVPEGVYWWLAAFVLFRLFDIWKPWPISWLDHQLRGGTGIMVDDLVAAFYAWGGIGFVGIIIDFVA